MKQKNDRRKFIKKIGLVAGGTAILHFMSGAQTSVKSFRNDGLNNGLISKYSERAINLVKQTTCIDMLATFGDSFHERKGVVLGELWENCPASFTKEDYEFVVAAGITIFGWGSMVPSYEGMLKFMAYQNGIIASNPGFFERIDTKEKT